ncbi:MAG: hypothetical protein JOZ41_14205 [Chloroflexi bacterium]|nr:hypothetical protein [Chloroflexota bacterium]
MSEVSTRIWLDDQLWEAVTNRAVTEGITVRELIPRLVDQSMTVAPAPVGQADAAEPARTLPLPEIAEGEASLPILPLADVYRCAICGAEVRLGGVSNHLGKHKKEREASEAERS